MFLFLAYFISLVSSTFDYKDSTLTITNEPTIKSTDITSDYAFATSCIIKSDGTVSIQNRAFFQFTSLKSVSIQVATINFELQSFQQVTGLNELRVTATDSIIVGQNAFQSAGIELIEFDAGNKIAIENQGFQSTFSIASLNLTSNGIIDIGQNAFQSSNIKAIYIEATESVSIGLQSFQSCSYITNLEIESKNSGISFGMSSFMKSIISEVVLKAHDDIIFGQQAMQEVTNLSKLIVITQGNFNATFETFLQSTIVEFDIQCNGFATFSQQSFQETPSLVNFTVNADQGIIFNLESFLDSNVNSMMLKTNGSVTFDRQSFQETKRLTNFTIKAIGDIIFGDQSFLSSRVNSIDLYSNGAVYFSLGSFQECKSLNSLTIHSTSNVSFGYQAFLNSQIRELSVSSGSIYLDEKSTVTFSPQSFSQCDQLTKVNVNSKGNVVVQAQTFQNSKSLSNVNIHADVKATVGENAFSGCSSLDEAQIEAPEKDVSKNAYGGGGDDGSDGGSSSHKDNDSEGEATAKTLGDIKIQSVYLGTSPNIYVNLNIFVSLMRKIRKTFGHIIPSPEFVHSAIWVGEKDAKDDSLGAIFVYGKYYNKNNMQTYLDHTGAKAYVMSLHEFKRKYRATNPMKLNAHRNINLFELINEIKASGKWGAYDYNWPTNNCQHFTAKLIEILKATRDIPNNDDWIDLPKSVLNSLQVNEKM